MNSQQARTLVKETFPKGFDKGRFREFTINLLNKIDESKQGQWNSTYIKDAFKEHVEKFERLGTYTSPDDEKLDVLIVHLTKESKLERARTAIRNFVADHLKQRDGKDAALVAFLSPSEKSWRFSYIKMEYAAVEKDDGKVGVQTKLTPARRSSYIVGEDESCHTAQSRFLDLLQDTENHPTLAQIEDAFSVEAVTKEFFEQYKGLFLDLKDELDDIAKKDKTIREEFAEKNVSTVDFAKKLMGQIVFLYFLQKKGWLGVAKGGDWGDGTHNFLRQLFDAKFGSYKNFFNDILEPLFYDTLATDRGHDAWCNIFKCRIPFLNGGLFEPVAGYDWKKTDINIPNSLFSNSKKTEAGDTGTGILDVFDRYNFTVNEAEPLEKEVAIDPEMLGKVFENLLEVKERKSKGSFYTPREIVHYMCQESLINYLDTAINSKTELVGTERRKQGLLGDEKAEQTLLTVPTRGELIPRADIETFIHLGDQISHYEAVDTRYVGREMPKTIKEHAKLLDERLADIAVCDPAIGSGAFPVGMMQEIVRARSALTPYFNDVKDRTAYHFKRHAIQSCIYGVDIDPGAVEIAKLRLWLSLVVDEDDVKQIKPLPNLDYKVVVGNSLLGVEKNLFNQELFKRLEELKPKFFNESRRKEKDDYKTRIDKIIHELTNGKEAFDFEIYFSEIFHHKKGFDVFIANPPYGANIDNLLSVLRPLYREAIQNYAEIYKMFFCAALRQLNSGGILAFITPNTFLAQPRYKDIRTVLIGYDIQRIVNLGEEVFEGVVVPTCLSFIVRGAPADTYLFSDLSKDSKFGGDLSGIEFRPASLNKVKSSKDCSLYMGKALRANEVLFDDALEIKDAGIQYHRSGIGLKNKGGNDLYERLFSDNKKAFKASKPVWYGKLIDRWWMRQETDEWFNLGFRDVLKSNESASFTLTAFEVAPKILWRQTASCLRATIDTDCHWFRNTIQCAYVKDSYKQRLDIYYLLGIINSRHIENTYNALVREAGRVFPQVKLTHVKKLPLVIADKAEQSKIAALVKNILKAKGEDANANIEHWEQDLNKRVDSLYSQDLKK